MKLSAFDMKLKAIEDEINKEYDRLMSGVPCFAAYGSGDCQTCACSDDCKDKSFSLMKEMEQAIESEVPVAEVPVAEMPVAEVPVAEVPVAEVPVAEVPVAEVPVAEVPVAEVPVAEVPVAKPKKKRARVPFDFEKAVNWLLANKPSKLKEAADEFNLWVGPGHRAITYFNCKKLFAHLSAHGVLTYDDTTKQITWIAE